MKLMCTAVLTVIWVTINKIKNIKIKKNYEAKYISALVQTCLNPLTYIYGIIRSIIT